MMNKSPWITQLDNDRPNYAMLQGDEKVDVCIVGAGIAGVSTAYFLLKNTDARVALIDAGRIAHGASGHNAGQIAPYFEKGFDEIFQQYGSQMAHDAQQAIFDARDRLLEMVDYTNVNVPIHNFIGYAGCSTHEQLVHHLQRKKTREITHNDFDAIFVSQNYPRLAELQSEFSDLFETLPQDKICDLLQTNSSDFVGALACKKGVTNSALLCQELVKWMLITYPGRLLVQENSPVSYIDLYENQVKITYEHKSLIADKVVLCTNGYKHCIIQDLRPKYEKLAIHNRLRAYTFGVVGYMSAYTDPKPYTPTAISYFMKENELEGANEQEVYFYLTRRPLDNKQKNTLETLLSLGGPEQLRDHDVPYSRDQEQPERAHQQIHDFFIKNYRHVVSNPDYTYRWHGLMGFTATGLRMVGPDKDCGHLIYNVGCNGVGILSSVHGGRKVSQLYQGIQLPPSVFDPQM